MAKLANDIIDTPALMAIKSHLRNNNPVVIAVSTNNALSGNAENIGKLLNRNNYYFVPFKQDNPITKPRSAVFDPKYIIKIFTPISRHKDCFIFKLIYLGRTYKCLLSLVYILFLVNVKSRSHCC